MENRRPIKKTSVAELKERMFASQGQAQTANPQRETSQHDIKKLQGSSIAEKRQQLTQQPAASSSASNRIDKYASNSNLASLKAQLFQPGSAQRNTQKEEIDKELGILQEAEGNVLQKAKLLEQYFSRSNQILNELRKNTVSQKAKEELTLPGDFERFEEKQNVLIHDVAAKLKKDIEHYANSLELQESVKSFKQFLKFAQTYRTYEVCLEQDLLRHIASVLKLSSLCDIPTDYVVKSLNYYQDFFKLLPSIQKIWAHAGEDIRKAEVSVVFAAAIYRNRKVLEGLLGDKESETYLKNLCQYQDELTAWIAKNPHIQLYISEGDGLDKENHPWVKYNYCRMSQPNTPIDFKAITFYDEVHAHAVEEVENRVEADQERRFVM